MEEAVATTSYVHPEVNQDVHPEVNLDVYPQANQDVNTEANQDPNAEANPEVNAESEKRAKVNLRIEPVFKVWKDSCSAYGLNSQDEHWLLILYNTPKDDIWHATGNCISYQVGVWETMLNEHHVMDTMYPHAFKMALILRHTPAELTVSLLHEMFRDHPNGHNLISYILALLTDDEASTKTREHSPSKVAPSRDRKLYGDLELAVLGSDQEFYREHCHMVRSEYPALPYGNYIELRIKVLSQLGQIPQLFCTPEFENFDYPARDNIESEKNVLLEEMERLRLEGSM